MRYGQKRGDGPNAGKTSSLYEVTLEDGRKIRKRSFNVFSETAKATAIEVDGKVHLSVWQGDPAWLGKFGILTARKV